FPDYIKMSFFINYTVVKENTDKSKFRIQFVNDLFQHGGVECDLDEPYFALNNNKLRAMRDVHESAWAETHFAEVDLVPFVAADVVIRYQKVAHKRDRYNAFMSHFTYDAKWILRPTSEIEVTAT